MICFKRKARDESGINGSILQQSRGARLLRDGISVGPHGKEVEKLAKR